MFKDGNCLGAPGLKSAGTFALLPVTSSFQLPPPGGAKNTRTDLGFGSVVGWVCAKFLDSAVSAHEALGSGGSRLVLGALGVFFCSLCAHLYVNSAMPPLSTPPLLPVLEARSPPPESLPRLHECPSLLVPELEDALCSHTFHVPGEECGASACPLNWDCLTASVPH